MTIIRLSMIKIKTKYFILWKFLFVDLKLVIKIISGKLRVAILRLLIDFKILLTKAMRFSGDWKADEKDKILSSIAGSTFIAITTSIVPIRVNISFLFDLKNSFARIDSGKINPYGLIKTAKILRIIEIILCLVWPFSRLLI